MQRGCPFTTTGIKYYGCLYVHQHCQRRNPYQMLLEMPYTHSCNVKRMLCTQGCTLVSMPSTPPEKIRNKMSSCLVLCFHNKNVATIQYSRPNQVFRIVSENDTDDLFKKNEKVVFEKNFQTN